MAIEPKSPAVQSYELDKAREPERVKNSDLNNDLEHTFPASDPVSRTITSIPGRANAQEAEPAKTDSADARSGEPSSRETGDNVRNWIRANPLTALAATAALAFIMGASR